MRYELHLTNFSDSSASITDVVIVDETTDKPLARIDGAELLHAVEIVGARNPTRRDALVESGRRAIVYLDFEPRAAPSGTLRHDLFFDILATSRAHHSKVVIRGSRVDKRPAAVFGPPLRGAGFKI
ncbi:MAG: hypothetical protein EON58_10370 [Alphaproteobacteria bacterium]|nr:MAG: hypothetical protein EON58_10370 [Alphaproteobacteria bacterium]